MNCSPPGSPVHGILQARTLEWVVISYCMGSSQPRVWTRVSCASCIDSRVFTTEPPGKPCTVLYVNYISINLEEMNKCQVYRANKKHLGRVYQEHLMIAGTTEEKERDGLKKNHNYVECHQFDALILTEHLLCLRPCMSHREDPSNTHWTTAAPPRPKNWVNTYVLIGIFANYRHTPRICHIYWQVIL